MATIQCRSCDSAADAGVSGSSRAAATMAKALNPCFGGRWKKRGKPPLRPPLPPSTQQRLSKEVHSL